jgi:hypothetical protein
LTDGGNTAQIIAAGWHNIKEQANRLSTYKRLKTAI